MFASINRTVFDIPLTWDRTRFEASRTKNQQARKLIEMSINAQYNKQLKDVFYQKLDIEKDITGSEERLLNQEKKVHALDNLTEVAEQSLNDYFDKRMENVRNAIQEHCNAIQQILREENDHWKEIHTAIDQNLITSEDIHPPKNINEEIPVANIHTIDEANEEEEEEQQRTMTLLNNKTVTPLLTQMIRKSRLQSNRSLLTEKLIPSKEERFSVIVPLTSARRTLPVIDTTFVVKIEDSINSESDTSALVEVSPMESLPPIKSLPSAQVVIPPIESLPSTQFVVPPIESLPSTQFVVPPIESLPSSEVEAISSYSQPKPPTRLYFSPTLLQDEDDEDEDDNDDESEPIQPVLSIVNQNQLNIEKSKANPRRFGQTFLLDNVKTEEMNKTRDSENIRPKISAEIPFMIHCDPTLLTEKLTLNESHHSEIIDHQKSIVYAKRRTRAAAAPTKVEQESIHITRRTTRKQKPIKEIETTKRQTRKRKQSVSDDTNNHTVALRKKKAVSPHAAKTNTRKTRVKKPKEIPIREPSPLPIIDRSKHYSTRFSTRSHRFNNLTLSTTTMFNDDDDNNNNKSKHSSTLLRTKSAGRPRKHVDDDGDNQILSTTRSKRTKNESQQRAKSMRATRSRKK